MKEGRGRIREQGRTDAALTHSCFTKRPQRRSKPAVQADALLIEGALGTVDQDHLPWGDTATLKHLQKPQGHQTPIELPPACRGPPER